MAVLIIFPVILQTVINLIMLSIGEQRGEIRTEKVYTQRYQTTNPRAMDKFTLAIHAQIHAEQRHTNIQNIHRSTADNNFQSYEHSDRHPRV